MPSRKQRQSPPEENRIINTHLAGILEDLNKAGIFCDGVLAFVTLDDSNYNLSTMMGVEVAGDIETASEALIQYAHDELCDHLDRSEALRGPPTPQARIVEGGIVVDRAVTESMGWRQRLESVRTIPREGAGHVSISVKMLDDVIAALDHVAKLEAGIRECEGDGGCRATKFVEEEKAQRPLVN